MSLPTLYHAPSSYYSMIARLALAEAGIEYTSRIVDIHRRRQNILPDYARIQPNLSVPAMTVEGRTLVESRQILEHALGDGGAEGRPWIDRHYGFEVEDLTFGRLLAWNPLARRAIPRTLAKQEAKLRALALENPDLAEVYLRRAEVFTRRQRNFDPATVAGLFAKRRAEACAHLDALEAALGDGRATLVEGAYGPADVVWTVFLARIRFARLGEEITRRPAVERYTARMFARPSFTQADVWESVHLGAMLRQLFG